ncbi:hypothetical protein V3C99_008630 [Haemonchus contortus]
MPKSLLPPLLAPPIQEITIPTLRFPSAATVISVTSKSTPDHFHDGLLQFYRTDIRLLNVSVQVQSTFAATVPSTWRIRHVTFIHGG